MQVWCKTVPMRIVQSSGRFWTRKSYVEGHRTLPWLAYKLGHPFRVKPRERASPCKDWLLRGEAMGSPRSRETVKYDGSAAMVVRVGLHYFTPLSPVRSRACKPREDHRNDQRKKAKGKNKQPNPTPQGFRGSFPNLKNAVGAIGWAMVQWALGPPKGATTVDVIP